MEVIDYNTYKVRKSFYNSKSWQEVRAYVLHRDSYECTWCKEEGRVTTNDLEIDHIKELQDRPDLKLEPDNLRTLCMACHNKRHQRFQYGGNQFKPKENKWQDEKW
ncbi:HNH endonuclease [Staphylococcus kloosii]|uniref:Putative HNH nuclease YajD n=1 Tax=Staphylococcus kloosii TaxID=29384 RepID=A0ABQ0XM99_9STAP|nr:HNH endonuclease [Staphylococcus kloosii]AVQ35789.1 HNH endonuclease [Staphylococcus kloosii]PNZ05437.1 HNH endonuclease [Staphylococcus kloosii]GEP82553.1 HNH endonuclease [Staphylococcus kloosii]SUM48856.1 phage-associated homing endonuclease [Staphylococcus kloosii]